jgi:TRAP transporter 4TM/12TM fusion protein
MAKYVEQHGAYGLIGRIVAIGLPIVAVLVMANVPVAFGLRFMPEQYLAIYLYGTLFLTFLLIPTKITPSGFSLGILALGAYVIYSYPEWVLRPAIITWPKVIVGAITILLVLEGVRRHMGLSLVFVVLFFIGYALFSIYFPPPFTTPSIRWNRLIIHLFFGTDNLFGPFAWLGATIIVGFMLFASMVNHLRLGEIILSVATATVGRFRGGPAKIAVLSSGAFGSLSGNPISNVMTTGVVTIPLMKRMGLSPEFAAATETVASMGGGLVPPVMGATAFLIAEVVNIPYRTVAIAAVVPALLYYWAIFWQLDSEAARRGLKGLSPEDIPKYPRGYLLRKAVTFLPGIFLLIYLIFIRINPGLAAMLGTLGILLCSLADKESWAIWKRIGSILEQSSHSVTPIYVVLSAATMIPAVISLTGQGTTLGFAIIDLAGGSVLVLLFFAAIISIIMGMGLPGLVIYAILASLLLPSLQKMGFDPLVSSLFLFYYGLTSSITPPICVAVFAAISIADTQAVWRTGITAMRLGFVAYLLPFLFVYNPALLLMSSPPNIILSMGSTALGITLVSFGFGGNLLGYNLNKGLRTLFFLAAVPLLLWHIFILGP